MRSTLHKRPPQGFRKSALSETGVLEQVRNPVFELDARHRITYCNTAAERLYGFSAAEVAGLPFGQATHCNWPPALNGPIASRESYDGWAGQVRQITPAGREMIVDISISVLHDLAKVGRFIIFSHEPAPPPQRESAVAWEERRRFDALLSDLSTQFSGLLEDDIDGAIESALRTLVHFLGVSRSSLAQLMADGALLVTHTYVVPGIMPHPTVIADDQLPWLLRQVQAGKPVILSRVEDLPLEASHEREMMTRSGLKAKIAIPLHVGNSLVCVLTFGAFQEARHWSPELISQLRVAGQILANAVARRQAKERLELKQRELTHLARVVSLSELASVIAHELDQPLTAIVSNAQAIRHLLDQRRPDLTESKAALHDIIAAAMRVSEIVHGERRLLRKAKPNVERLDLNELVREIELFIRADARQHGSGVKIRLSTELPNVVVDRVQLQQVVLNLTRNAIQAMSAQPSAKRILYVGTVVKPEEAVLAVRDGGPPINDECLAKMFEPFFTTKSDGLGMGLAISRSIVQAHRGRMWATRNPGMGLTFRVAIPRDQGGATCLK
jgi:PAS domain S-box-containing protein